MRKTFFYLTILIAFLLLVNIIQILTTDFQRLTEYGLGYLTGKIILFLAMGAVAILLRKKSGTAPNRRP